MKYKNQFDFIYKTLGYSPGGQNYKNIVYLPNISTIELNKIHIAQKKLEEFEKDLAEDKKSYYITARQFTLQ